MPQDDGNDDIPDSAGQLVAGLLQWEQVSSGDLLRQREPMAIREHGIIGTVNDERRCAQFPEPFPPAIISVHDVMVRHARRDERQRRNSAGMIERHELSDRAAHRHSHQMGAGHAKRIEQTHRISSQVT